MISHILLQLFVRNFVVDLGKVKCFGWHHEGTLVTIIGSIGGRSVNEC